MTSQANDEEGKRRVKKAIKRPKSTPTPKVRSVPEPRSPDDLRGLSEDAYYGLAGDIVREIEPRSEGDPAAILVQLLAAFGNAVGRGPGFRVEADRHHTNLFVGIVGETASARKGSSWGQARRLIEQADPKWASRIKSGASSGEGLIWEVRDSSEGDPGVEDKRLLVVETELASPLERMTGSGNTLSPVLRQAWDGGKLNTLVKTNPAAATNAHLSFIGHITAEELQRKLTATEQANGFANRFLWIYARRSKLLSRGGGIEAVDWTPYVTQLRAALSSSNRGEVGPTERAWQLWDRVYADLSTVPPGMLGAATARAPAQVRRLSLIYALLDKRSEVTVQHLRAALAVWRYAADSAALLFGRALGDPTADAVLAAVRAEATGLRRTDLSSHFSRHRSSAELDRAVALLSDQGLVEKRKEDARGGRPAVRLLAVDPETPRKKRTKRKKVA